MWSNETVDVQNALGPASMIPLQPTIDGLLFLTRDILREQKDVWQCQ